MPRGSLVRAANALTVSLSLAGRRSSQSRSRTSPGSEAGPSPAPPPVHSLMASAAAATRPNVTSGFFMGTFQARIIRPLSLNIGSGIVISARMSTAVELARSGPLAKPRICCLDLDTFFVSVERLLDPTLEGKPVVVGGRPGSRGVVTSASYEVRAFGVKSGMSLTEAGKLAPNAIYLPTRHETYGAYAERVREIAR